ncbi:MAG: hypothetical protein GWN07_27555, partial [Actinobacteria bacterium]|nr:hypothetical protein [Actinomycetota bacterium]NIS34351.1 hypothetical protein [Actinomycetota bacterium]NIU69135.1 hypothetical protein [Actinomycetota bacterium]NIV89141.1 hypothetical protein [Actinomycetota bacterium]NIW30989.1 hypothetical protein [Actinomycetota bacterium]
LALSCSDPGVACGGAPPNLMGGDYHVLWFTTAGPFPTDAPYQRQLAIVFNDSIGVPWVFGNPFIYDTFNGAAIWI